jgi:ADP-ribose diphosphatase
MWSESEWFALKKSASGEDYIRPVTDEVLIVALDDQGDVIFSREPSAAFGEPVLILPGGSTEPSESHEATAVRELQEEIGFKADRLDFLGELRPWSKYLELRSFVYVARDLTPSKLEGDEEYEIGSVWVPLAKMETLIATGQLRDARAIAALYMTRSFLEREHAGT